MGGMGRKPREAEYLNAETTVAVCDWVHRRLSERGEDEAILAERLTISEKHLHGMLRLQIMPLSFVTRLVTALGGRFDINLKYSGQYREGGKMDAWLPGRQKWTGAMYQGRE